MLQSFMVPGCHVEGLRRESRSLVVLATTGATRLIYRSVAGRFALTFNFAATPASTRSVGARHSPSVCQCCSGTGRGAHGGLPRHRRR
jgi:hypothetical protein